MNAWTEKRRTDDEIDALLSGRGTATALVDVAPLVDELRTHYADRPAPTPNVALEHVFAWGLREEEQQRRAPAIAWLPGRGRERAPMWTPRRRVAVAVLAATLALGGLAVAGAVPAVQDAIADVADVFGVDLPRSTPEAPASPTVTTTPGAADGLSGGVAPLAPGATASPGVSAPGSSSSSVPGSTPTSVPSGGGSGTGIDVPPITVPAIDVPPITLPELPIDVPPIDVPPITVPPIDIPPVTLPPLPPIF
jgi:hypothetical protein